VGASKTQSLGGRTGGRVLRSRSTVGTPAAKAVTETVAGRWASRGRDRVDLDVIKAVTFDWSTFSGTDGCERNLSIQEQPACRSDPPVPVHTIPPIEGGFCLLRTR
jgi:hypothetical protein